MSKSKTVKKPTKSVSKVTKAKPKPTSSKKPKVAAKKDPPVAEEAPPAVATVETASSRSEPTVTELSPSEQQPADCPRGGAHEWREDDGERFCDKCKEPAPTAPVETRSLPSVEEPKVKKLSAIDAAAKLLAESGEPLNCQQMIAQIAAKGYWTSPGGKTPAATLYSSIIREIKLKGAASRFIKTERGKFAPATVS